MLDYHSDGGVYVCVLVCVWYAEWGGGEGMVCEINPTGSQLDI